MKSDPLQESVQPNVTKAQVVISQVYGGSGNSGGAAVIHVRAYALNVLSRAISVLSIANQTCPQRVVVYIPI